MSVSMVSLGREAKGQGGWTFEPLSANFFQADQPDVREVEVVYWFSLASHPVIIEANIK